MSQKNSKAYNKKEKKVGNRKKSIQKEQGKNRIR